jgi:hypothetical protein
MAALAIVAMSTGDNIFNDNSTFGYMAVYSVIAMVIAANVGVLSGFWRCVGIGVACLIVMSIVGASVGMILREVVKTFLSSTRQ